MLFTVSLDDKIQQSDITQLTFLSSSFSKRSYLSQFFWVPENCAMYLKFSRNFHSDLAVYDACLQGDPVICHFLLHFPVTHQQISSFQRKKLILTPKRSICMHVTKLLIFNLIESYRYFEDSMIGPVLRVDIRHQMYEVL